MVGRLLARVVLISACLVLISAPGAILLGSSQQVVGASQVSTTVGVDADPTGNEAASLGQIDACISVATGETFDVDVVVTDVTDLSGYEADFVYDGSVVSLVAMDPELFLAAEPGSNLVDLSAGRLPDTDGTYHMLVADVSQSVGEDGSGVLARLTLQAVGQGASDLSLSQVILGDSSARAIGDTDGDSYFDGPVSKARVYVDEACPSGPLPGLTPASPSAVSPEATPASPAAATPTPGTVEPISPAAAATGDGSGFPWAIVGGASAGGVVVALALALVAGRLLQRGRTKGAN
jgi:hypothetical protein